MTGRRIAAWIGAGLVGVVGVVLASAGVGVAWVATDGGERFVAGQLRGLLDDQLAAGGVSFGELDVAWGDGVRLHDVVVTGASGAPVVQAPLVHATVRPASLLGGQIRVETLRIPGAVVHIGRRPDGGLDLPAPTPSEGPSDPDAPYLPAGLELAVDAVRIRDARVSLPDDDLDVRDLTVVGGLRLVERTLAVDGVVASASLVEPEVGPIAIAGDLRLVADTIRSSATVEAVGVVARGDGVVALEEVPRLDQAEVVATASREGLVGLLGAFSDDEPDLPEGFAAVRVDARAHGPLTGLVVDGRAHLLDHPATRAPASPPVARVDGSVHLPSEGATTGAVHVRLPHLDGLAPLGLPADVRGELEAVASFEVPSEGPVALRGEVRSPGIRSPQASLRGISVPAEVLVSDDGGTTVEAQLAVDAVQASDVRAARATGEVDLTVTSTGDLGGTAHLALPSVRVPVSDERAPHVDLRADARFEGDRIGVEARVLDHDDDDLRLDVDGSYERRRKTVRVEALRLIVGPDETLENPEPWRATVADGGVEDVRVSLRGAAGSLWVQARRLGSARQTGRLQAEDVDLGYLRDLAHRYVELPPIAGIAEGWVAVDHGNDVPPALNADLVVDGLQATDDVKPVDVRLEGRITDDVLDAKVRATADDSARVWVTAEGAVPLRDRGMWMACEAEGRVRVDVPDVGWEEVRTLAPALPELPVEELGDVEGGGWLSLQGDLCDPASEGAVQASATYDGRPIDVHATVDELGDHRLEVQASVELDGVERATAEAQVGHTSLDALIQGTAEPLDSLKQWDAVVKLLGVPVDLALDDAAGRAYGRIGLEGDHTQLASAHAGLQLVDVEVDGQALGAALHAETDEDLVLTGELTARVPEVTGLDASGRLHLQHLLYSDDPLGTSFALDFGHSELPLQALAELSGGQLTDGEGVLVLDGGVEGSIDAPRGDLTLSLDEGQLTVASTGIRYGQITLDAQVDGQKLALRELTMASRPRYGRYALGKDAVDLRASGSIRLEDDLTLASDVAMDLDRFWAIANGTGLLEMSGDLVVDGTYPELTVSGELEVDDARFDLPRHAFVSAADVRIDEDIQLVEGTPARLQAPDAVDDGVSVLDVLDVDAELDLARSVKVNATVPLAAEAGALGSAADLKADASLDGELEVDKDNADVAIDGAVQTEGDVRLLSARFDIERGTIAFSGSDYAHPQLDIALRRSGGDYGDVTARIGGSPRNLSLDELSSEAYGDEADVMALLLFGRPLSELDAGESQGADQLVQSALLSVVGSQVEEALGASVVDSVRYDPGDGLALGWSLSTDAFLTLALDPTAEDDENMTVARINWLIGNMTELELATGDAGDSEGWLLLETRF